MALILGSILLVLGTFVLATVYVRSREGDPADPRAITSGFILAALGLILVMGSHG